MEIGQALIVYLGIDKVLFIGEVGIGKVVMCVVFDFLKVVILELGGKLLLIVFEDVDLDNVVFGVLLGNFYI